MVVLTPLCVNNMDVENSNLHVCFIASRHRRRTSLLVLQQLRAAIAPCIESVFLLDRLCYLYEQVYQLSILFEVAIGDRVSKPRPIHRSLPLEI